MARRGGASCAGSTCCESRVLFFVAIFSIVGITLCMSILYRQLSLPSPSPALVSSKVKNVGTDFVSVNAALKHVSEVRQRTDSSVWGSTLQFPTQWMSYYWVVLTQMMQGKVEAICEVGMGPGYSALMLLAATTTPFAAGEEPDWTRGAHFFEFDIGIQARDGYGIQKKAAHQYILDTFGPGRASFLFGDSATSVKNADGDIATKRMKDEMASIYRNGTLNEGAQDLPGGRGRLKGLVCDVVHIDGLHTREGVLRDIRALRDVSHRDTKVLLDDVNMPELKKAIEEDARGILRIETKVAIQSPRPEDAVSAGLLDERFGPRRAITKTFVVARFLYA
eukprot:TRINITY_DN31148_c2_g1_i1.p1 TRINITY_DN31148_c2_g1~~TRINITY_DN31148_c2_g1_i1.p1  ORF type:complete len:336 (-),score=26.44 TRINITY_DN31148_c2_g1_i1:220-1227(-)